MTMTNTTAAPFALKTEAGLSGLSGLFTRLASAVTARIERRATYHALSELSDRQLDDIGFTRGQVEAMR